MWFFKNRYFVISGYLLRTLDNSNQTPDNSIFPWRLELSLVFICRLCICEVATGIPPGLLLERMRTCTAGNLSHRRALQTACLQSWTWVNFAGMPGVNTGMSNVAGCFCSHTGTVSQAVPAAMSQVRRRHMRTRFYRESTVIVFHSPRSWNVIHRPPTYAKCKKLSLI